MEENKNTYRILVRKPAGRRLIGTQKEWEG
jgi:hypothetical protein